MLRFPEGLCWILSADDWPLSRTIYAVDSIKTQHIYIYIHITDLQGKPSPSTKITILSCRKLRRFGRFKCGWTRNSWCSSDVKQRSWKLEAWLCYPREIQHYCTGRERIKKAKAQCEIKLASDVKGNEKGIYIYKGWLRKR